MSAPHDFGAHAISLRTSVGPGWVVNSAKHIPAGHRAQAFAAHARDFRYYELLEDSLREQFSYRYFVLQHEATGDWAVQPFFFVQQDLLAGLPAAVRSLAAPIRRWWPGFLKLRMMMIGCAAGEGELDRMQPWIAVALRDAIAAYRPQANASIILWKDFPASHRALLGDLVNDGFQRVPSMPAARLTLDFANFEDYMMTRLGRVFRKNLRRKFRALENAPPLTMEVLTDVSDIVDEILPLQLQTFHRSEFKFEELNRDYFRLVGQRMPDRARFFIWRQNGRIVAFNLCFVHEGVLHDLGVGLDYTVALDLHLYFVTWRDVIQWCLLNGVRTYHTGPLNYDPKLHFKLTLAPLDLYARHQSALINPIFKLAIKYLEPTRHDPVLQRFENASELYG